MIPALLFLFNNVSIKMISMALRPERSNEIETPDPLLSRRGWRHVARTRRGLKVVLELQ